MGYIMTSNDVSWAAGVVDGEGTITLAKQIRKGRPSPAYREAVTVANCDKRILEPFHSMWGGNIYTVVEKRPGYSDSSTWHCPQGSVKAFLEAVLPFLRGKREQAGLLLEFIAKKRSFVRYKGSSEGGTRGGSAPLGKTEINAREQIWQQFKKLNAKGKFKNDP